jgi:hypothetical protein
VFLQRQKANLIIHLEFSAMHNSYCISGCGFKGVGGELTAKGAGSFFVLSWL